MALLSSVAALIVLTATAPNVITQRINAFTISKDVNDSVVRYDARLTSDCRLDPDHPVEIYWATPDPSGKLELDGLNFIQSGIYGIDVQKQGPDYLEGEVKALQDRGLHLKVQIRVSRLEHGCSVKSFVSGDQIPNLTQITSIRLEDFHGMVPSHIAVNGWDAGQHRATSYRLHVG